MNPQTSSDPSPETQPPTPRGTTSGILGEQYARDGAQVVVLQGELDLDSLSGVQDHLTAVAAAASVLVLDLTAVAFADSTCLNLLLMLRRSTDLRLAGTPEGVLRLLEVTGADQLLRLFPTVGDALGAPQAPPA